jgi:hypothetical protein
LEDEISKAQRRVAEFREQRISAPVNKTLGMDSMPGFRTKEVDDISSSQSLLSSPYLFYNPISAHLVVCVVITLGVWLSLAILLLQGYDSLIKAELNSADDLKKQIKGIKGDFRVKAKSIG